METIKDYLHELKELLVVKEEVRPSDKGNAPMEPQPPLTPMSPIVEESEQIADERELKDEVAKNAGIAR